MIKQRAQNIVKIYHNYLKTSKNLRNKEMAILTDLIKKMEQDKLREIRASLKI